MNTEVPEVTALKEGLKETWTAGDYGLIARGLEHSAQALFDEVDITASDRVLDVACGTGQWTVPAARTGAETVGADIAENWLEQARARASAEGLSVRFDVGDAEDLPYEDGSFDVVLSLIGAMFAPRPERAASEMMRVCRPGGRIVMVNWTPEGFVGGFFRLVGKYAPPPDMPSPLLWGDEEIVRERFREWTLELTTTRKMLHFDYPMGSDELATHYFVHFGPTKRAAEVLAPAERDALRDEIRHHWASNNQANDGTTQVDAEVLEVVATKAS